MKYILNAIKEGRLVELPDADKNKSLEYLAVLLEAVPDIKKNEDIVKGVFEKEATFNTGLGDGIACPHVRTKSEGELLCAIGWSPTGVDYDSNDGQKVHLMIMYYIPDAHRNTYLKEISGLAKAIKETKGITEIEVLEDLQSVRHKLLDWVELAIDKAVPDFKVRMIQLEEKNAEIVSLEQQKEISENIKFEITPFSVIVTETESIILCKNSEFTNILENGNITEHLESKKGLISINELSITVFSEEIYSKNRKTYSCGAVLKN